jgi:hypothetical protein
MNLAYLSCPYSDPSPSVRTTRYTEAIKAAANLMLSGRFVLCPVIMNHPIEINIRSRQLHCPSGYWQQLEQALSISCSELIILTLPGWKHSRGIRREIGLFRASQKPIFLLGTDYRLLPFQANTVTDSGLPTGAIPTTENATRNDRIS